MKKRIVYSGKKVIALLLLLVVLFTYMPANIVYGVSDVLNSEPENELKVDENKLEKNEFGGGDESSSQFFDANFVSPTESQDLSKEIVQEEPVQGEPVQEEPAQREPVQEEPVQEELVQEELVQEEPVQEEPVQGEPVQEEPVQEEPVQGEPVQGEPVQEEPVQEEPVQGELVEEEPVEEETVQEETVEEEIIQDELINEEEQEKNKIEIVGNVTWKDNGNSYGTRPTSLKVSLIKNNDNSVITELEVIPNEEGNWNYKFENVEEHDENGIVIEYKINVSENENYKTVIDGFNVNKTLIGNTSINGNIIWEDQENINNLRPEFVTVNVCRDNEIILALGVNQDENGLWNYNVNELEKYDENGTEINYSVGINEIENYKSTIEKISGNEFNIKNVYTPKFEMDISWQDILMNGPYISMNVEYAREYGLELSKEELYIYEKYQEMLYERGPELAAIAMFAGTKDFTEEEIAIYNTYQEIIINGGEKSPIALLGMMENTGNAIKNNGTEVLAYITANGSPVHNSIKYVAPNNRNKPQNGDRVAYCVNYDRSYDNGATYDGTSWEHIDGQYGPVYLKLYSELSYLVTIGCKTYGGKNDSAYSTGGDWKEDYYATQTAIYNLIYDYTRSDNYTTLKAIVKSIKAEDPNGKLKNINPNSNADLEKIAANIRATFTGHPGGSSMGLNSAYSRASNVKTAAVNLYNAVVNYRNNIYDQSNADGYNASILITNNPQFNYVQQANGKSYYEATVNVTVTGKNTSSVTLSVPSGVTATRIGTSNDFKLKVSKDKMATLKQIKITASAKFDLSRTITYLSAVPGTQNVAFYQDAKSKNEVKTDSKTLSNVKTIQINGSKTWKDNNNSYNTRPSSIKINLFANGTKVETKTVTESNSWKWSFTGYPEKDNSGKKINYTITENDVSGYTTTISGYNVENKLSGKTEIQITKNWKDNGNSYNTRPEKITINLLRNNAQYKSVNLTSSNQTSSNIWKYTFKDLDKYDSNGKLYTYKITENAVKDYQTVINGNTITNTLVGEIEFAGNKTWFDNNNAYSTRPDTILVELFANGAKLAAQNVNEDSNGDWKFVFDKLAKYDDNGKLISYEIKEVQSIASDYESKVDGKNLINTLVGKTKVSVKKAWNDDNNHHETRPEKITINLLADGTKVDSHDLTENDNWFYTFDNLEKYTNLGVKINYTITEEVIAEVPAGKYVTTINEMQDSTDDHKKYEVTNCLTGRIDVRGTKIWKDNNNEYQTRPENITVNLYKENKNLQKTLVKSTIITSDADGNWKYEFLNLEKYDEIGVKYDYTIEEVKILENVEGYYADSYEKISESNTEIIINITNTLTGETELGGDKLWKDNNNAYGTRPESIIVNLLANGQKVQDKEVNSGEKGDWKFLFANLIKFDENGKKIEYSISENEVIDYVGKIEDTKITNTLTGKTEVIGIKIWHDDDNDFETRPESIIVKLLANGEEFKKKTVKADENGEWKFSFEDLDEYDENGVKIIYTIDEKPVDRYVTEIKGTTIINTLVHNHVDIPSIINLDETPKTGRKNYIAFFSLSALISLVGLFIVNKKEEI